MVDYNKNQNDLYSSDMYSDDIADSAVFKDDIADNVRKFNEIISRY